MFAIKDLESLNNLAHILVIPFFAAAYITDGAWQTLHDPLFDWLRNHDAIAIKTIGWAACLLIVVAFAAAAFLLVDAAIVWLHVRSGDHYVMAWAGFACLTAGLFVFAVVLPGIPQSPLNPFWHLALLCYGLSLVERAAK